MATFKILLNLPHTHIIVGGRMKGQLSAEMLIVLAIILGLVFIAFTQLTKITEDVSKSVDDKTQQLINANELRPQDVPCSDDSDCDRFESTWTCGSNGYCQ